MRPIGTVKISIDSTTAQIATAAPLPPIKSNWLRPCALSRLHDPAPPFRSGLSNDFLAGRYGRSWATIAWEKEAA
jgi:hypothetical protein